MINIMVASRRDYERQGVGLQPHALVSFRDPLTHLVKPFPSCLYRLDLTCHDVGDDCAGLPLAAPGLLEPPSKAHVDKILHLWNKIHSQGRPNIEPEVRLLVVQCEAGVGRSAAVAAALLQAQGDHRHRQLLQNGVHNRRLHRLMLVALGLPVPREPLVCLAVRVKYPLDRTAAFVHCMRRQRHQNWKVVFVTDGPFTPGGHESEIMIEEDRCSVLITYVAQGMWGHPYRQLGIDRCLALGAEYVGLSNDDNWYCPGYLEQMVWSLENAPDEYAPLGPKHYLTKTGFADFASCQMLHHCTGWRVVKSDPVAGCVDLGNWLASADLIRQVPWATREDPGLDYLADGRFVERLAATISTERTYR
jgi:predicted protein tyrosine phosphatase